MSDAAIQKALAEFKGVGAASSATAKWRPAGGSRFTLVDDYGHHPAEMAATLARRVAFPGRRPGAGLSAASATRERAIVSRIS